MERQFFKGCEAIAEAAIRAGCRFYAGYPITPQNEIPEYMANYMEKHRGVFLQAESEIAAIYMVYGAACSGVRAMTSSSGPGISLKAEGLSYLASARLPAVIVNVTRGGPGLGKIQPAQNDYWMATKASGHGGFKMMVFAPASVQEAVDLTYLAFDYADRDRNPVMLIPDGVIGAMMEPVVFPEPKTSLPDKKDWILDGCMDREARIISNSLGDGLLWEKMKKDRAELYERWEREDVRVEEYLVDDAEFVVAAYGTSARVAKTAIQELRKEGYKVGLIRPITVNPFPFASFQKLDYSRVKGILDVEMSFPGQMIEDVRLAVGMRAPIHYFGRDGGNIVVPKNIVQTVKTMATAGGK